MSQQQSHLNHACSHNQYSQMKRLVKRHSDLDLNQALELALQSDNMQIAWYLIGSGADVFNAIQQEKCLSAHNLALLFKTKFHTQRKKQALQFVLTLAIKMDNLDIMRRLVKYGVICRYDAMITAVYYDAAQAIEYLLESGLESDQGLLSLALSKNHVAVAKILLSKSRLSQINGQDLLFFAIQHRCCEMVEWLLQCGFRHPDAIYRALDSGSAPILNLFLPITTYEMEYFFLSSVSKNQLEITQLLLRKNNIPSDLLNRGLLTAISYNHLNQVRLLYSAGADVTNVPIHDGPIGLYLKLKIMLHSKSKLWIMAAKTYVATNKTLPTPGTIPEEVMQVLVAAMA